MKNKVIVSLFDYSGTWSKPYRDAGYTVVRVDSLIQEGTADDCICIQGDICNVSTVDILDAAKLGVRGRTGIYNVNQIEVLAAETWMKAPSVHGIISATPCTAFTKAGSGHWKKWNQDGTTLKHLELFDQQMNLIELLCPTWWALENPPGRLANKKGTGLRQDRLGKPPYSFHPYEFVSSSMPLDHEERYTKQTYLWGSFNEPEKQPTAVKPDNSKWGGHGRIQYLGSSNKRLRSKTPVLFSEAFFQANP